MVVSLSGSGALYQQVYRAIRAAILSGRLRAGDRLPVSRTLARDLAISRNVILIAYDQLIAEGYVVGRVGAGTFVAAAVPGSMLRVSSKRHAELPARLPAPHLSRYAARSWPLRIFRRARHRSGSAMTSPTPQPAPRIFQRTCGGVCWRAGCESSNWTIPP